jgi:hypothetical protein
VAWLFLARALNQTTILYKPNGGGGRKLGMRELKYSKNLYRLIFQQFSPKLIIKCFFKVFSVTYCPSPSYPYAYSDGDKCCSSLNACSPSNPFSYDKTCCEGESLSCPGTVCETGNYAFKNVFFVSFKINIFEMSFVFIIT